MPPSPDNAARFSSELSRLRGGDQLAVLGIARAAFSASRFRLGVDYPFFGSLLSKFRISFTSVIPTAAVTNDERILINPDFFAACTPGMRLFVLAHEILHPALGYFVRSFGHDPQKANIAHDHVINLMLKAEDFELVPGIYADPRFAGKCYEEIYHAISKESPPEQSVSFTWEMTNDALPNGSFTEVECEGGDGHKSRPLTTSEIDAKAHQWDVFVREALQNAAASGKTPACAKDVAKVLGQSRVNWLTILRHRVGEGTARSSVDWSNPSRRSASMGFYAPREITRTINCAVYFDTSGSISDEQLGHGLAELDSIMRKTGGKVQVLTGDAKIQSDLWMGKLPDNFRGRGGTSFVPVFAHIDAGLVKADCIVIFTDTWGDMPKRAPRGVKVIWAVYSDALKSGPKVPFGEIVEVPVA